LVYLNSEDSYSASPYYYSSSITSSWISSHPFPDQSNTSQDPYTHLAFTKSYVYQSSSASTANNSAQAAVPSNNADSLVW